MGQQERAGEVAQQQEKGMSHSEVTQPNSDVARREVLTKAVYITPAIVTLPVLLSFASAGSGYDGDNKDKDKDKNKDRKYDKWKRIKGKR
jgi:hypothetical protein